MRTIYAAMSIGLLAFAAGARDARAFPLHARYFAEAYGRPVGCPLCHERDNTRRNFYGEAWAKAGETRESFRALEALDSDGDGVTNGVELAKGSNPGDPKSTPEHPGDAPLTSAKPFIPTESLELVLGETKRLELSELELAPDAVARAEKDLGRPLNPAERWLTLYFSVDNGKRKDLAFFAYAETAHGRFVLLVGVTPSAAIKKVVVLKSGDLPGGLYARYVGCFAGKTAAALPAANDPSCAVGQVEADVAKALYTATHDALILLGAALRKRAP